MVTLVHDVTYILSNLRGNFAPVSSGQPEKMFPPSNVEFSDLCVDLLAPQTSNRSLSRYPEGEYSRTHNTHFSFHKIRKFSPQFQTTVEMDEVRRRIPKHIDTVYSCSDQQMHRSATYASFGATVALALRRVNGDVYNDTITEHVCEVSVPANS